MGSDREKFPAGIRLMMFTILKLLLFVSAVSLIYGYVNGAEKGLKLMGFLSIVLIAGQLWVQREDIINWSKGGQ